MYGRNINFTLLAPSLWAVVQAIGSNVEEEKYKILEVIRRHNSIECNEPTSVYKDGNIINVKERYIYIYLYQSGNYNVKWWCFFVG